MIPFFMAPFGWIGGLIGLLIAICIIGAIIRAIVFAAHGGSYRNFRRYHRHHHHWEDWAEQDDATASARKILDERYAKGEIDDEEYKKKKENLK